MKKTPLVVSKFFQVFAKMGNLTAYADLSKGIDLSIPVRRDLKGVSAFHVAHPSMVGVAMGGQSLTVAAGKPMNCEQLSFCAHTAGTHTECDGHITLEHASVHNMLPQSFMFARVISVTPKKKGGDCVIRLKDVEKQIKNIFEDAVPEAIIIRTYPNNKSKKRRTYSDTNPPYFHANVMAYFAKLGVQHFLCDLPSVDRESDGGKLLAHKAWWGRYGVLKSLARSKATITELVYIPDKVKDDWYLLDLQTPAIMTDAVPSRPVLYPCTMLTQK